MLVVEIIQTTIFQLLNNERSVAPIAYILAALKYFYYHVTSFDAEYEREKAL